MKESTSRHRRNSVLGAAKGAIFGALPWMIVEIVKMASEKDDAIQGYAAAIGKLLPVSYSKRYTSIPIFRLISVAFGIKSKFPIGLGGREFIDRQVMPSLEIFLEHMCMAAGSDKLGGKYEAPINQEEFVTGLQKGSTAFENVLVEVFNAVTTELDAVLIPDKAIKKRKRAALNGEEENEEAYKLLSQIDESLKKDDKDSAIENTKVLLGMLEGSVKIESGAEAKKRFGAGVKIESSAKVFAV
jgi:hypothetical protein